MRVAGKVWIAAARPRTLPAAAAPVFMGTALARGDGGFHLGAAAAALMGALLIQIGTNFANDYLDYVKGVDAGERLGPTRATQAGLVSPPAMKRATMLGFALALLVGMYLVWRAGWPVAVIGLSSILFGVLYTAGPLPLSYTGLADLLVLVCFGPVAVAGTYYVQTLEWSGESIIAGLGPGLLSTAILTVNNLRDIRADRTAGKRTLAVRFGAGFAKTEYLACFMGAVAIPPVVVFMTGAHAAAVTASVMLLVTGHCLVKRVFRLQGRPLNDVLAATGQVLLAYAVIFSLGWLW